MSNKKVTIEDVRANMQDIKARTEKEFDKPVTVVTVRMRNGFTIRESTTCVDPENYDERVGIEICLKKIEEKIWFLLGYELQNNLSDVKGLEMPNDDDGDEITGVLTESRDDDDSVYISVTVPSYIVEQIVDKWFS